MSHGGQTARQTRTVRGTVAAAIAVLLAATSHTFAGGAAPAPWLLLAVTLLAAPLAVWLVGRRPSVTRIALAVAAAQLLLHVSFAAVGDASPTPAAHVHVATTLPALASATHHHHFGAGMLAAHLLAAVLTTLLLSRGEHALRVLARGLHRLVDRIAFRPLTVAAPARLRAQRSIAAVPHTLLTALSRRGPPALSC